MSNIQGLLDKYKTIEGERFFGELFKDKEYEVVLDKNLETVFDIGACAGEFSAYIYEKAGVIYALEPFPNHYKELVNNINEFGLDKIHAYDIALSDQNGVSPFLTIGTRGGNHLADKSDTTIEVTTTTLAAFVKEHGIERIDLLKIDIEGDEIKVFGSKDFPEVAPLITCIIGEHLDSVRDILEKNGFVKKILEGNQNALYEKRVF